MRILIVEDEVKIRRGLAALIAKQTDNEIVGEAKNGREGLALILRTNPDLVITDVRMPEMDGLEMLEALTERQIKVHCVILSGYSEFDYAKKAIRYGVDDYLLKPLAPEDIIGLLNKIGVKLAQESKQQSDIAQRILRNRLYGTVQDGDVSEDMAELNIEPDRSYYLLSGYGWDTLPDERREWLNRILTSETGRMYADMHCCLFDETREVVCILPEEALPAYHNELSWYIQRTDRKWIWAKAAIPAFDRLHETMELIHTLYLYGQKSGTIVTESDMATFSPEPFSYPDDLEGKLRAALYREDVRLLEQYLTEFQNALWQKPFLPQQIKDSYVRLVHRMLHWIEDAGKNTYEKLEPLHYANKINHVYTREEMNRILDEILRELKGGME
ncbi:MAG: response regulator, partial [Lachnospiraceae bacterium]|nr:response regulator [Lachnospiraceae bacterium]